MSRFTRIASTIVAAAAVGSTVAPTVASAATTSPKNITFAYLRDGDVYVGANSVAHRLTTDKRSSRPRWSPDGKRIAYLSGTSLWVMNADGSGKRQAAAVATGGPSWSPDGRWLAYVGPNCNSHLDVLKVAPTGAGKPVSLLPSSACAGKPGSSDAVAGIQPTGTSLAERLKRDSAVAWSPDGRRVAFRGGDCQGIYDDCLSVEDLATGKESLLDGYGGGGQVFSGFGAVPAWRPDGGRLSWTAYTDGDTPKDSTPVHLVESTGTGSARHSVGTGDDRELAYVNSGQAVLTASHNGGSWLALVDLATGTRSYLRPGSQASPRP